MDFYRDIECNYCACRLRFGWFPLIRRLSYLGNDLFNLKLFSYFLEPCSICSFKKIFQYTLIESKLYLLSLNFLRENVVSSEFGFAAKLTNVLKGQHKILIQFRCQSHDVFVGFSRLRMHAEQQFLLPLRIQVCHLFLLPYLFLYYLSFVKYLKYEFDELKV